MKHTSPHTQKFRYPLLTGREAIYLYDTEFIICKGGTRAFRYGEPTFKVTRTSINRWLYNQFSSHSFYSYLTKNILNRSTVIYLLVKYTYRSIRDIGSLITQYLTTSYDAFKMSFSLNLLQMLKLSTNCMFYTHT